MTKSFTAKLVAVAALTSAMLFAPLQATAQGGSQGGGVKCFYVLVSYDPATGTEVFRTVCGKGV
jgi:hypothetical protein